jgi:hypothetical protein
VKKVSESELKRLKKKGKVRKKLGAQPVKEKPASVAPDDKGMSGSKSAELPVSAPTPPPPAPVEQTASMAASMAVRDGLLERVIENNTAAIAEFRQALAEQKPRAGVPYRHRVIRDKKSSLIDEVISTPMES